MNHYQNDKIAAGPVVGCLIGLIAIKLTFLGGTLVLGYLAIRLLWGML